MCGLHSGQLIDHKIRLPSHKTVCAKQRSPTQSIRRVNHSSVLWRHVHIHSSMCIYTCNFNYCTTSSLQSPLTVAHLTVAYLHLRNILTGYYCFHLTAVVQLNLFCLSVLCHVSVEWCVFACVRFSFFSTKPNDWLGRTSPKWSILC